MPALACVISNLGRSSSIVGTQVVCRKTSTRLKARWALARAYRARTLFDCILKGFEIIGENPFAAERLLQVSKKELVVGRGFRCETVINAVSGAAIEHQPRVL